MSEKKESNWLISKAGTDGNDGLIFRSRVNARTWRANRKNPKDYTAPKRVKWGPERQKAR